MNKKEEMVNTLLVRLSVKLTPEQLSTVQQSMYLVLNNYEIADRKTEVAIYNQDEDHRMYNMFFVSKKVSGLSMETLNYYGYVLQRFFHEIQKDIKNIDTNDIRYYLAERAMRDGISKVTQDNELRVLKSFFNWQQEEGYLQHSPARKIAKIKQDYRIKKAYSEIELEKLRRETTNKRDLAIVDILYSTGCRVSEIVKANREDIAGDELIVYGKGGKERVVYLNPKAVLTLSEYINDREDDNEALFVHLRRPHSRLKKEGIESMICELGKRAGVKKAHPHRFRRTVATNALNRGMPMEEVQQLLGHNDIQTTSIYAKSTKENVKADHKKYVV